MRTQGAQNFLEKLFLHLTGAHCLSSIACLEEKPYFYCFFPIPENEFVDNYKNEVFCKRMRWICGLVSLNRNKCAGEALFKLPTFAGTGVQPAFLSAKPQFFCFKITDSFTVDCAWW